MALAAVLAGVTGASAAAAPPADQFVSPGKGWQPLPSSQVATLQHQMSAGMNAAGARGAFHLTVKEWRKSTPRAVLVIALTTLRVKGMRPSALDRAAAVNASAAAASMCSGAVAAPPKSDTPVRALAHSHFVVCPEAQHVVPLGLSFSRGSVFAMLFGLRLTRDQLIAWGRQEYQRLGTAPAVKA